MTLRIPKFDITTLAILLLFVPSLLQGQDDYKYVDRYGNEIKMPKDVPIYTSQKPGPWTGLESLHEPFLKTRVRLEGLETILVLDLTVRHPMGTETKEETGRIQAIYVLDKDDLMIGYSAVPPDEILNEVKAKIWINGVINYVKVYVLCSKHDFWLKEFSL